MGGGNRGDDVRRQKTKEKEGGATNLTIRDPIDYDRTNWSPT